ncbi:hypothetical protein NKH14_06910 [Mesorhizobium sp. M1380]|uniref:hypothetical protein n=1 Tax=Mesorhizobium sp. M1380 TaxID=2957093 RepID=UPI00333A3BAB
MANRISRAAILTVVALLVISAIWQAFRTACAPVAQYGACRASSYFYWGWFYDYQTLIAGLVALAGAWWGVRALNMQMRQAEIAENQRLESRRTAARVTLPFALSAISEYAEVCANQLEYLIGKCDDHGGLPADVEVPSLPPVPIDAVAALRDMTEAARSEDRSALAALLAKVQIQQSRIGSLLGGRRRMGGIVVKHTLQDYFLDSAELYARASSLFGFARGTAGMPDATIHAADLNSALHNMGIFDDDELYDRVKGRTAA